MTFDELRLLTAIRMLGGTWGDMPTDQMRREFASQVAAQHAAMTGDVRFPWSIDDVIKLALSLRKQIDTRTKADIAIQHGVKCFWEGRGKGACTDEAEAGHLVPKCRGGQLTVENAVIECRGHNNQRREMTIEEYLLSDKAL